MWRGRRILQVFEIGRKLSMIALDAETMSAVCFAEKQEVLSQPSGFAVIRLSDGAESAFVPAEKPESYVARGGWILSASADGTGTAFRPGGSEKKSFRTGKKPRLEFTGDGKQLIAASDDAVRFLETKNFREVRRVALPAGTRLFRMVQGSADGSLVYCSSASDFGKAKVYLVMTGGVKKVADDSTGEIVCNPKDHSFFHGRLLRNRLSRLDPGTFEEVSYCDPKNLRPATSGKTLALFLRSLSRRGDRAGFPRSGLLPAEHPQALAEDDDLWNRECVEHFNRKRNRNMSSEVIV